LIKIFEESTRLKVPLSSEAKRMSPGKIENQKEDKNL